MPSIMSTSYLNKPRLILNKMKKYSATIHNSEGSRSPKKQKRLVKVSKLKKPGLPCISFKVPFKPYRIPIGNKNQRND